MARINRVFLRGAILKPPQVAKDGDQFIYARVYVSVVRSSRAEGSRDDLVCDVPLVMTRETKCIKEIESWEVNDIVSIKGVLASRRIKKSSFCKSCGIKVQVPGVIMYIAPVFCEKICHLESESECMDYLDKHRDVSTRCWLSGPSAVSRPNTGTRPAPPTPSTSLHLTAVSASSPILPTSGLIIPGSNPMEIMHGGICKAFMWDQKSSRTAFCR